MKAGFDMWKMIGFMIFWMAFGMFLMLLISNTFAGIIIMIIMLIVSYNMVFCKK